MTELELAGAAAAGVMSDDLARDEIVEPLAEPERAGVATDEGLHTLDGEHLAEDARRAEHALHVVAERVEAALHDPEDGVGQRVGLASGDRTDQLLEEERVAARALDDALDVLVGGLAPEHLADEVAARLPRERVESELDEAARCEQLRERRLHLGPREREHEERRPGESLEGRVDELHADEIAPVQVLEHEEDGVQRGLGAEPVHPRGRHRRVHEEGIAPRRRELGDVGLDEARPDHLAEERGDAEGLRPRRHGARDSRMELGASRIEAVGVGDLGGAAHERRRHHEGRARAEGVRWAEEHLDVSGLLADDRARELASQPALSHPSVTEDE